MVALKTNAEIDAMAAAGAVIAEHAKPGQTTADGPRILTS
jgi:hypothetical protein